MSPDMPGLPKFHVPPEGLSIKILGCGGIGGIVARYGTMQWAAMNVPCRVALVDGDHFELSNASRMFFSRIGNKAAVLRDDLLPFVTGGSLTLLAVEEYLTADNAANLIREGDVTFSGVDNMKSRKLLVEHIRTLENAVVISGGNDGVEMQDGKQRHGTFGTIQCWVRRDGRDLCPDLMRYHPEIQNAADRHPGESKSCGELMASVPQLLLTNLNVASNMLSAFNLLLAGTLGYFEQCLDIAEGVVQPVLFLNPPLSLVSHDEPLFDSTSDREPADGQPT